MRHLGKTVLNGLLMGAAAGALTVGFASKSYAGALAYSTLENSNFRIFNSDGSQVDFSDLDVLEIGDFTNAGATLNGSGTTASDSVSPSNSDVAMQCVGDCAGIAENDFSRQAGPLRQFARADAVLSGAGITGTGADSSVTARSVAEVQLNQTSTGTANSAQGTSSRFSFTPDAAGALTFTFDATPEMMVLLEQDDVNAFASLAWSIGISAEPEDDGDTTEPVFTWVPDGLAGGILCDGDDPNTVEDENATCVEIADPFTLNTPISTLSAGPAVTYDPGTGTFSATTPILQAGQTYILSINEVTTANANVVISEVPEPAAAALFGFGLLGLAGLRRRKA